ncbi:MAG: hypothetical protein HY474_02345 [Candidatus Sungbacteria bacterium]|uniref:DUF5673 domain-containing protein n=1 Tax=Candidatus Sungiibacteriota bacterium TaxID=2750080 RepID=A0A933DTZ9_9BACT|nr:hypothetical protein [Candidatus Sungbacteria bacterium]
MANTVIDLRKLKNELKGGVSPENELSPPSEPLLLENEDSLSPREADTDTVQNAILEWTTPDAEPEAIGSGLQLLGGGALLIGAVVALFFRNFLFALLLILSGLLVIGQAFRAPRQIRFAVTARGIKIGSRLYEFDALESFWIFYDPPLFRELALRSRKHLMPVVKVPLGDTDPLRLRQSLLRFLPEEEQELSLLDIISKRLGF